MEKFSVGGRRAPSVVCIGGGTGLSTMLRGLKAYTPDITAIVTVADDGGGSGILREELGMLPPGDIRNCILSLADMEPIMERLLNYRFQSGHLAGQSFGNLFLAAMDGICTSFDEAVSKMCDVLAITGRVLPVSTEDVHLIAEFDDGSEVYGESKIFAAKKERDCRIEKVRLVPENPQALPETLTAIHQADIIVIGPGSLYTSIIPNLLVNGISEAVAAARGFKLYVCNVMTQDGETEGYSAADHIRAIFRHAGHRLFDVCLLNSREPDEAALRRYAERGQAPVRADRKAVEELGVALFEAPVSDVTKNAVRHNAALLAEEIFGMYRKLSPTREYPG